MIRPMERDDLDACAHILMSVYNNEMWQAKWDFATARAYLLDYVAAEKFVGFVQEKNGEICGAMFCHEKIWWTNSELFLDEMFIRPDCQRQGLGSELIAEAERYVRDKKLAGLTLTTNRYAPAPNFYRKNGFSDAEHVLYMFKEMD